MCPSPAVVNVILQYRSWWLAHDLEERRLLVEIVAGSALAVNHDQVLALQAQLKEMSAHLEGLEEERLPKVRFFLPRMWSGYCSFAYSSHICFFTAMRYRDLHSSSDGDYDTTAPPALSPAV